MIRFNPTAASSAGINIGISSLFAFDLFTGNVSDFEAIESEMNQQIDSWLKASIPELGLPLAGAGTEYGLEDYLAARVKISENQLKSYYVAKQKQFVFEGGKQVMPCNFKTQALANQIRTALTLFTDDEWSTTLESSFYAHCDVRGDGVPHQHDYCCLCA